MTASSSLDGTAAALASADAPTLDRMRAATALATPHGRPPATIETREVRNGIAGSLGMLQLADAALTNVSAVGLDPRSRMWLDRVRQDIADARAGVHALVEKCAMAERAARGD